MPPLAEIQTAWDNFSAGWPRKADGGPSSTVQMNNCRLILTGLMRQLGSYVAVACKGDMANLILSGFPVQKPVRQPVGPLATPGNVVLELGAQSGGLNAKANPVFGASIYNWRLKNAATGAVVQTDQTPAASTSFTGLTPGVIYSVEVNAVGTAGPSDWGTSPGQMVI